MQDNGYTIDVAYKVLEKAIINELYKKEVIDICQYNNIINKINSDIYKINEKNNPNNNEKIVIKIKK